jgi:hypothetical protein
MKRLDGHVWGDRYWSKVLEGEPLEDGSLAGEAGCGDCEEESAAEAGEQNPKAHLREGPPGGDSHIERDEAPMRSPRQKRCPRKCP